MIPEDSLSEDDRLSLLIGRVARVHVDVDVGLRVICLLFSPPEGKEPDSKMMLTSVLIRYAQDRLKEISITDDLRRGAELTLKTCCELNRRRNRVVHDMWMPPLNRALPIGSPVRQELISRTGLSSAFKVTSDNLKSVEEVLVGLERMNIRIMVLYMALIDEISGFDDPLSLKDPERQLLVLNDRFTMEPGGSYNVER